LGPTSLAVEPRSMMTSPSGTGALLGCHVVIWVGSSSSTLRRRRRVVLRWEPRGPPVPRPAGPPPRPGAVGAPVVGPPVRGPPKPVPLVPPGREGPPVRGAPVEGRALMGRDPPAPGARLVEPGIGRRAPGGGGMGRPVALSGRPGGGGMGRPVALSGGRVEGAPPSPPPSLGRCVGRIVVGPSGDAVRVGTGFTTAARLRTTFGPLVSASGAGAGAALTSTDATFELDDTAATGAVSLVAFATLDTRTGASAAGALTASTTFAAFGASSGSTTRRSPSASARRRIRSAWASSMDAEGLDAPMPSFWASASNSLLVRPSSFESSCTRIFFCAKTFP
jgi:hypothetical protein